MQTIFQHKLLSLVVLLVVIFVAWFELSSTPAAPTSLIMTTTVANSPDQQLVATLLTLRAVTLSGTILTDPAFRSLQDFTTQIQPEPVGRVNPFAPLSGAAAASASLQQGATPSPASQNTRLFAPKK
jgi:hypothetical protein